MKIINHQLIAEDDTLISELPKLHYDTIVNVWIAPVEFYPSGYFVATGNEIPPYDHETPVFSAELKAHEPTKAAHEFDLASANVRSTRDKLLSDCDWTQVEDSLVDKQAWATYRQSLRDITSQSGFPFDITYPTAL